MLMILLAGGVGALAALWLWGAWLAGFFVLSRSEPAARPDDAGGSAFSRRKRLLDAGQWTIALVRGRRRSRDLAAWVPVQRL